MRDRNHDHDSCLAQAMAETPQCADLHEHPQGGVSRRWLLTAAGLAGGGGLALGALPALPAAASPDRLPGGAGWRPDHDDLRFTLVVMPDTQYLFDNDRVHPAPLDASLRWILANSREENIVFLSHLGDLTQNGLAGDFAAIGRSLEVLDRARADYSVVAGNHDINSGTDDQRGDSPYRQTFGPQRFSRSSTFGGASPDGYNTYHVFRAAGRQWLVLALDWRPSAKGIAWAQSVIDQHPRLPVIVTTHDVHVHITNYQDRYFGGGAMIRTYRFDLSRRTIDVRTFSPYMQSIPEERRSALERLEVELTDPANAFSVPIDFGARFNGFDPVPVRGPRPARAVVVPGTLAYWRFDGAADGSPVPAGKVRDQSGNGNDLTRVSLGGGDAALTYSNEHHPDQPGTRACTPSAARTRSAAPTCAPPTTRR